MAPFQRHACGSAYSSERLNSAFAPHIKIRNKTNSCTTIMKKNTNSLRITMACALLATGLLLPQRAFSHCDTMDGPVVLAAKTALAKKDVTPVLKWITPEAETEIKAAFARTLAVRTQSKEAQELADQFFFETLVRIHRAGESAPFTGLKPAGTELSPAIEEADKALESGSVDNAVKLVTDEVARGIRKRFAEVCEKKAHAEHNVEAGREFVAAYVDYVHYVEGLHQATEAVGAHHTEGHETVSTQDVHHELAHKH